MKRRGFFSVLSVTFFSFLLKISEKSGYGEGVFEDILKRLSGDSSGKSDAGKKINIKRNSQVVVCRKNTLISKSSGDISSEIQYIFEESVKALFSVSDSRDVLKSLFSKDDVIGIKVNCLAGRGLSSNIQLVDAIIASLKKSGIDEEQIIIWDRTDKDLLRAGYKIRRSAGIVSCFGTDKDYENEISFSGSVGSCFSRILTRQCTAVINVPVLKDHDLAGVSIGMKNFYGAIHNPNKYHDDACNPFVADLNLHPEIRSKLRLTVCDAITAQYHGGPAYSPGFAWDFNGLLVATDPVALDSIGLKIIEDKRNEKGMKSFKEEKREPLYIRTAEDSGLGTFDRGKIKVTAL